ncbi:hypothetical protein HDU76_006523 [Blyttiomyces sp. JEL0837]|nr:hypothetical protein HDU76_006523 [Blyttiomyces sp. JEL0837]
MIISTTAAIAVMASFTGLVSGSPIERRGFSNQYPYGSSDVSIINIFDYEDSVMFAAGDELAHLWYDVQFAVKNKAFVKDVGVRFTNDSWASYYEAPARYSSNLGGGYEMWNLTVSKNKIVLWGGYKIGILTISSSVLIHSTNKIDRGNHWLFAPGFHLQNELAAFVSFNHGPREWDPSNNYLVCKHNIQIVRIA